MTNEEHDEVLEKAAQAAQAVARHYSDDSDARSTKAAEVCASNIRALKSCRVGGTAK